ncbi:MAG: MBL fold metallo-hydrolase [Pirellulales bacterium]
MSLPPVERFDTSTGVRIYRMSGDAFPTLVVHAYLLLGAGPPTLVDAGSGYGKCTEQLLEGLETVRTEFGEAVELKDIRRIIVTHGHIDHFGGVPALLDLPVWNDGPPQIAIHELDRHVLTAYEERVVVATKGLRFFLEQAGVDDELLPAMMEMYGFSKKHVRSVPVDISLVDGQKLDGLEFIHTPGHCPGQVCIRLGDVLLSADHVLERTSPHQAPESITAYTGLGHYLEALEKVRRLDGIRLSLGGHEGPIHDLPSRVGSIKAGHLRKLDRVLDILRNADSALTVAQISQSMYPKVEGFHVLLALEETGAHVEYLYQRGQLSVDNLEEVEQQDRAKIRLKVKD